MLAPSARPAIIARPIVAPAATSRFFSLSLGTGTGSDRARNSACSAGSARIEQAPTARHKAPQFPYTQPNHSHIGIIRSPAAFGHHPVNVLSRVLDVAGFAVDAILGVDLQARIESVDVADDLVDSRWTVPLLRRVVE